MPHWCDLCEMFHSSGSCYHPARKFLDEKDAQLSDLRTALAEREKRLKEVEGLLLKSTAVIEDMRMVDRYNSRVDFDVEDHLKNLQTFLSTKPLHPRDPAKVAE